VVLEFTKRLISIRCPYAKRVSYGLAGQCLKAVRDVATVLELMFCEERRQSGGEQEVSYSSISSKLVCATSGSKGKVEEEQEREA